MVSVMELKKKKKKKWCGYLFVDDIVLITPNWK